MINCPWKNLSINLLFIFTVCFTFGSQEENVSDRESQHSRLSEDDINQKLERLDFCLSANLKILPVTDTPMNKITVFFMIDDEMFRDCFTYYMIFLEQKRRTVNVAKVMYIYDIEKRVSYTFHNISCGIYEVVIQPCYNDWQCAPLNIKYPKSINMSSADCFNFSLDMNNESIEGIRTDIIILAAVISVLFTFISGLVYYCYWSYFRHRHSNANEALFEKRIEENKNDEKKALIKRIDIFIFHYYGKNEQVTRNAKIFRDFLVKSSFYSTVRLIETELVEISQNPFEWLNKTLEEESEDGSIVKIIIIDSLEDDEVEESEIESCIYTQAIDILGNNLSRSLADYDNLFVVRFDGTHALSRRIANFVRGHRYLLSNYHHLISLCINLCSGSGLDTDKVKEKIEELYFKHEIRNLGLVQHI